MPARTRTNVVLLPTLPGPFLAAEEIQNELRGAADHPKVRAIVAVIEQHAVELQHRSQSIQAHKEGWAMHAAGGADALAGLLDSIIGLIHPQRKGGAE